MRDRKGLTFLELIITVAILGVSLTAVIRAYSLSLKTVSASASFTKAALLAEARLQETEFRSLAGFDANNEANCAVSTLPEGLKLISCSVPIQGRGSNVSISTYTR